jgi:hypothetical protein
MIAAPIGFLVGIHGVPVFWFCLSELGGGGLMKWRCSECGVFAYGALKLT